jgi:hypothetical protein
MHDLKQLEQIYERLAATGRMTEILDDEGKIQPSKKALKLMNQEFPNPQTGEQRAEAWRWAQARTLLDLADKYQAEMQ